MRTLPGWMLLAACVAGAAPSMTMAQPGGAPPRSAAAAPKVVTIEAMRFAPARLEVHVGDTVTWKNKDPFPHTVTADGKRFDSGNVATGANWKFKARKKGVFPYVCTLHPGMRGELVVD